MKRRLAEWVVKWQLALSLGTVGLYLLVLLPVTVIVFPDTTLWLGLLILVVGFLDEMRDLGDNLAEWLAHQQEKT